MSFASLNLQPHVASGVRALGFAVPTPIQLQSIPPILDGRDLIGLAQTGTGKTAAFALPLLDRLLAGPRGRIRALIVAPTRELAEQIHEALVGLGRETRLRSTTLYGGVSMSPQVAALRRGVDIVVACPGRLLDHLSQRTLDLGATEILVLDEADRMLDMGFLPDVRKIFRHLPRDRQTLLFSATMPHEVRELTREILRDPVTIEIAHAAPPATVSHALYPVDRDRKTDLLLHLLSGEIADGSVLVFTRTKHRAHRLAAQVARAGHRSTSLQGNLSQNQRRTALEGFRSGRFRVLVATDIAARGIDVASISHVINFDVPQTADAYTHRVGRTGRAERTGDAFTFVTPEEESTVRAIERMLGQPIERRKLNGFATTFPKPVMVPSSAPKRPQPRAFRSPSGGTRRRRARSAW